MPLYTIQSEKGLYKEGQKLRETLALNNELPVESVKVSNDTVGADYAGKIGISDSFLSPSFRVHIPTVMDKAQVSAFNKDMKAFADFLNSENVTGPYHVYDGLALDMGAFALNVVFLEQADADKFQELLKARIAIGKDQTALWGYAADEESAAHNKQVLNVWSGAGYDKVDPSLAQYL